MSEVTILNDQQIIKKLAHCLSREENKSNHPDATSMETLNEFRRPALAILLSFDCLLFSQGLCLQAHDESRRPFELNAPRRKLLKVQINYLQQHLNNYYFVRSLSVRPFGTCTRDPQIIPGTQPFSCRNLNSPKISKTGREGLCCFRWEATSTPLASAVFKQLKCCLQKLRINIEHSKDQTLNRVTSKRSWCLFLKGSRCI